MKFELRFEEWKPEVSGIVGTIRTKENYYVADVLVDGRLDFRGIEAYTRNINEEEVVRWFDKNVRINEYGR